MLRVGLGVAFRDRLCPAASLTADGLLDPGYQLGFNIGFIDDMGNAIGDGKLYFGINGADNSQFLYFQMPLAYVDNTYGTNADASWTKGHTFDNLLGSDALGSDKSNMPFTWNSNSGQIDYIAGVPDPNCTEKKCAAISYRSGGFGDTATNDGATDKNDGKVLTGNTNGIVEVATSLEYNLNTVDSTATTNSSLLAGWIKEVGYEIQFAAGTFNASDWLDATAALSLISLGSPHVSPSKEKFASYDTPVCIKGCSAVPLPAALPLMFSGLSGLGLFGWIGRRRSRRRGAEAGAGARSARPRQVG